MDFASSGLINQTNSRGEPTHAERRDQRREECRTEATGNQEPHEVVFEGFMTGRLVWHPVGKGVRPSTGIDLKGLTPFTT